MGRSWRSTVVAAAFGWVMMVAAPPAGATTIDRLAPPDESGSATDRTTQPLAVAAVSPGVAHVEAEPVTETGHNDDAATGEPVDGFGTRLGHAQMARLSGNLAPAPLARPGGVSVEDDGSIATANATGLTLRDKALFSGRIGDGPHGSTSGDTDFWALGDLAAGTFVLVDVETGALEDPVDTQVFLYDADGAIVASNDDGPKTRDSLLVAAVPLSGSYYVAVVGCCGAPIDPFDSAGGAGFSKVGDYEMVLGLDVDLPPTLGGASSEDDGAIPLANEATLAPRRPAIFTGEIGDGPHGTTTGDIDFFALGRVARDATVLVDVDTSGLENPVDTLVGLYSDDGTFVAGNDDFDGSFDSFLQFQVPEAGDYFVAVAGCCALPADPFDPASGVGPGSVGSYRVVLGVDVATAPDLTDVDVYVIDLAAGDVISAGSAGSVTDVELRDPAGVLGQGSTANNSFAYPLGSPLRHQGDVGVDHVARVAGSYAVIVRGGVGAYRGELRVRRSGAADAPGSDVQIIFVDFDGAAIDMTANPFGPAPARLSALSSFLFRWGLDPADEDAVIDGVLASLEENLSSDLRASGIIGDRDATGIPGQFDVEIRNSRDHADPWGQPNVTRLVIGGAVAELQLDTIGIAESIDPGNLDREETAIVLLDALSGRGELGDSLNAVPRADGVELVELVGLAIGNVGAHEIGHLLGAWHTETFNDVPSLMDAGGDLFGLIGAGEDGIFGTADDVDVDFATDVYVPFEGFTGEEDTAGRAAMGLTTGRGLP